MPLMLSNRLSISQKSQNKPTQRPPPPGRHKGEPMQIELNKIILGDCLDVMKDIPDKSVDLVILDPPYNIGKDTWDKIDNYQAWLVYVFKECERVLSPAGSMYLFHNKIHVIFQIMENLKNKTGFIFKQFVTWCKIDEAFQNNGYVKQRLSIDMMRNYYGGFTEYCIYYTFQDETGLEAITDEYIKPKNPFSIYLKAEFEKAGITNREIASLFPSKTGGMTGCVSNWINGDNVITETQYLKIRHFLNGEYLRKEYEDLRKEYEDLRYKFNVQTVNGDVYCNSNVWFYPPGQSNGHLTPKPVTMIENIIRHSTNKKDLILDPFAGSGTSAEAAVNTHRNFIAIEKEPKYVEIAKRRVANAQPQLF